MIYRLYFNRCEDFPQVWSVDEGTPETEVNVIGVRVTGHVRMTSRVDMAVADRKRDPVAWVEVEASELRVVSGCAVFTGD